MTDRQIINIHVLQKLGPAGILNFKCEAVTLASSDITRRHRIMVRRRNSKDIKYELEPVEYVDFIILEQELNYY